MPIGDGPSSKRRTPRSDDDYITLRNSLVAGGVVTIGAQSFCQPVSAPVWVAWCPVQRGVSISPREDLSPLQVV